MSDQETQSTVRTAPKAFTRIQTPTPTDPHTSSIEWGYTTGIIPVHLAA